MHYLFGCLLLGVGVLLFLVGFLLAGREARSRRLLTTVVATAREEPGDLDRATLVPLREQLEGAQSRSLPVHRLTPEEKRLLEQEREEFRFMFAPHPIARPRA